MHEDAFGDVDVDVPPTTQPNNQALACMTNVTRDKLQLVGVAAFMAATTIHEDNALRPDDCACWTGSEKAVHPDDCAYWTDSAYTGLEVAEMEQSLLTIYNGVGTNTTTSTKIPPPTTFDLVFLYLKVITHL